MDWTPVLAELGRLLLTLIAAAAVLIPAGMAYVRARLAAETAAQQAREQELRQRLDQAEQTLGAVLGQAPGEST